jgi:hypothetical protein
MQGLISLKLSSNASAFGASINFPFENYEAIYCKTTLSASAPKLIE